MYVFSSREAVIKCQKEKFKGMFLTWDIQLPRDPPTPEDELENSEDFEAAEVSEDDEDSEVIDNGWK